MLGEREAWHLGAHEVGQGRSGSYLDFVSLLTSSLHHLCCLLAGLRCTQPSESCLNGGKCETFQNGTGACLWVPACFFVFCFVISTGNESVQKFSTLRCFCSFVFSVPSLGHNTGILKRVFPKEKNTGLLNFVSTEGGYSYLAWICFVLGLKTHCRVWFGFCQSLTRTNTPSSGRN